MNDAISAIQAAEKEQTIEVPGATVELMVKPLEMLINGKNTKAYPSLLAVFQVLAAANLLSFEHKVTFLDLAMKLLDSGDDMIPIKVVQILLIMLTKGDIVRAPLATKVRVYG